MQQIWILDINLMIVFADWPTGSGRTVSASQGRGVITCVFFCFFFHVINSRTLYAMYISCTVQYDLNDLSRNNTISRCVYLVYMRI